MNTDVLFNNARASLAIYRSCRGSAEWHVCDLLPRDAIERLLDELGAPVSALARELCHELEDAISLERAQFLLVLIEATYAGSGDGSSSSS